MMGFVMRATVVTLFCAVAARGQGNPAAQTGELARHQQLAQQYLARHQPEKAIPELRAVIAAQPTNIEAQANLGVLLYFAGQFSSAVGPLQAAVSANGNLTRIRALLGMAKRRSGQDAAGRADLEAVFSKLEDQKLKIEVGRELIESDSAAGDLDGAATTIATLLRASPADPSLLYISYRVHNQMAIEALLALALAAPDSPQVHQAMAHELQRERDLPGTIANLRKALALDPNLPGIHFELAEALHASDDQRLRAESVEQYRLAVKTAPNDAKAATRLGDILVEQDDFAAAGEAYRQALRLAPGLPDAQVGLANVLSEQGDSAGALKLLTEVEAADPTNSLAHFRLSVVYRKLKRPDDVKREVELYQHYKDEREKLKVVYQNLRVTPAPEGAAK